MFSDCILHIGMEKTGTTTIQELLSKNRSTLMEGGYYYSRVMGRDNHVNLITYTRNDDTRDNQRLRALAQRKCSLDEFRDWLVSAFSEEATNFSGRTLVLSNEHLQSRATKPEEKTRLHRLIRPVCSGNIDVYIYIRRQDLVAVSVYGTSLLSGGGKKFGNIFPQIPEGAPLPYFYDYLSMWRQWCDVFGKNNVHLRVFDVVNFANGDVGQDFLQWTGIEKSCSLTMSQKQNESISKAAQYFMTVMNALNPTFIDGKPNPLRGRIDHRVIQLGRGEGLKPSRSDAVSFYSKFKDDNKTLFREAGLGISNFSENFENFPSTSDELAVSTKEVAQLGTKLFIDLMEENNKLLEQLERLKAARNL